MIGRPILLAAFSLHIFTSWAEKPFSRRDEKPALPFDPNTTPYCTWWYDNDGSIPCSQMPALWVISLDDFRRWNPSITAECSNFVSGKSYCVEAFGEPPPQSSTVVLSTTSKATPTSTGGPPGPTQPGQVQNCNRWDLVKDGDTCGIYISKYPGLTLKDLVSWNPGIGDQCQLLWIDTYLCTGVPGFSPITTSSKGATPTPTNGIVTPTPIQSGMVGNCDAFHKVVDGDGCAAIAQKYGISLSQFYSWNPAVGTSCASLWLDTYVCVSIIGVGPSSTVKSTTIKTSTVTTPTNGIATPTPVQNGIVNNCDAFHKVVSGDGCAAIASKYGISLSQFYTWNPTVGSNCASLWLDYYVCVSIIGVGPTPTTTLKTSTTTKGNGVATPTPYQSGMTTSCKTFHKVVSGDECAVIAKNANISLANFYKWNPGVGSSCGSLWLDYYVCIAIV
ncbi:uncharacterized protein BDR25DRAFT_386910 [Lindgomyces ingoldianus]|uniref:Uncharacterized protein n=1 Tax=Lindgomyces ingoldianus TaxID=673940 RepID=A0ACB6R581_9PLEO|nr:uncharacterized protein BDR25DRAFT_386910 [Lindgomyces ingoldianus]KAF2473993.1 hypothetical protein BDR25DRAFT_386910 [Lindgomyces ingoldianus]